MQHEEHSSPLSPGFGTNTNGVGILIVTIVAVCLALFCWDMWKGASKEAEHYRLGSMAVEGHGHEHESPEESASPSVMLNPADLGKLDTATGNFIFEIGDTISITLPDAAKTVLRVGSKSTEAKLFKFLSDPSMSVNMEDKTQGWITCDRIYFETGKETLTTDSKKQIKNIATILSAFPDAELKVGGYTDNTGSAAINTPLSNGRALIVQKAIIADGGSNAVEAEGYGPLHPIATNETSEGKALNRRVDLRVIKK